MDFFDETTTIKITPADDLIDKTSQNPQKVKYLNETTNIKIEKKLPNLDERNPINIRKSFIVQSPCNKTTINNYPQIKTEAGVSSPFRQIVGSRHSTPVNIIKIVPHNTAPAKSQQFSSLNTPQKSINIRPLHVRINSVVKRPASELLVNSPHHKMMRTEFNSPTPQTFHNVKSLNYPVGNVQSLNHPVGIAHSLNYPVGNAHSLNYPVGNAHSLNYPVGNAHSLNYPVGNFQNSPSFPQNMNKSHQLNYPIGLLQNNLSIAKEYKFEDAEFGELTYNNAYMNYQPAKIKFGKPHPYVVVESRSLSTEEAPSARYQLQLSSKIIDKGILSNVQLEAVIYACQKHEDFLTDGRRAGFLIGDGAGVGKGRTVAGIIYENLLQGRTKAIWVSVSNDLREDAKRDLKDIGREINLDIKVRSLNKMSYLKIESKENGRFNEGVLFVTYSSLISKCKKVGKNLIKTRFEQIVKWFGKNYDGVIILDECHKAKNLHQSSKTKTGTLVKKLQDTLKQARIVYASATGASEPKHMAYMVRLGLWGPGKLFKTFEDLESTLTKHGVGAMELVAMEMKRKGMYLARQLSFEDVKFEIKETQVENSTINGHKFKDVYNKCVELWNKIYQEFKEALKRNKNKFERDDNSFEAHFWSAHQRFFKYLCISGKVDECVKIATEEIKNGNCIVIGLQTTGESSIVDSLEETSGETSEFVSNAKGVIKNLIKNHYPSTKNLKRIQEAKASKFIAKPAELKKSLGNLKAPGKQKKETPPAWNLENEDSENSSSDSDSYLDEDYNDLKPSSFMKGIIEDDNEMVDDEDIFSEDYLTQQRMLKEVEDMDSMFPTNALDQLIQEFGGPDYVAELTGRKGRMVEIDEKVSYQSRKEGDIGLDQINLLEKDRFNNAQKLVAIISDAASTGISLHSDRRFNNQLKRFHITLELPWSADKAIQQFGRTHRSNQCIPPHYMFLISDLPGERRFAATVAKRLESLGALTHGDRRCADTRDLSQFNLDTEFGKKAVTILMNTILNHCPSVIPYPVAHLKKYDNNTDRFKKAASKALIDVGLESHKPITVTKFLNRILGIQLDMQNALFQYFMDIIDSESEKAKLTKEFDHGIRDIMNEHDNIFKDDPETIKLNPDNCDDNIKIHKITNIFMGISWRIAEDTYLKDKSENMFCESNSSSTKILALAEHQQADQFKLITPNFPEKLIDRQSLYKLYNKMDYNTVQTHWEYLHRESEHKCLHTICKQSCFTPEYCTYGKRTKINYIITGDIFLAWKRISSIFPHIKMEIARIQLHDKSKLIGALISPQWYKNFIDVLIKK